MYRPSCNICEKVELSGFSSVSEREDLLDNIPADLVLNETCVTERIRTRNGLWPSPYNNCVTEKKDLLDKIHGEVVLRKSGDRKIEWQEKRKQSFGKFKIHTDSSTLKDRDVIFDVGKKAKPMIFPLEIGKLSDSINKNTQR